MELGLIGLGRMGANMARRLTQAGHPVIGYTRQSEKTEALVKEGAIARGVTAFSNLVNALAKPRTFWLMLSAVLSSALYSRFSSRGEADFADKLLSALRYEFGGHVQTYHSGSGGK
ncbi:MAG: 6-phosphogluconate dehydrogenase [Mastigocladus sp. ERB_26_2]|uniref:NAD(P)-binding domain-containing protein n=1 Tax=Fischerella thermalis TaxID=372787 RepID=UPI000C80701A|nr:NAD(P)-binding domain-containing protein [Fischerella thermalis]PLZ87128.1 6-phosphogluconate dehydrogenase [Fischerella thermalis CCMEE 5194]